MARSDAFVLIDTLIAIRSIVEKLNLLLDQVSTAQDEAMVRILLDLITS